jgi:hypothetical protein
LSCIALVCDLLAYRVDTFFHASYKVLAMTMKGVIVGEVDARIALRISLSYLTQRFFVARRWGVIGRGAL